MAPLNINNSDGLPENDDDSSSIIQIYLHPSVELPSNLRSVDLTGCPVADLREYSPSVQQSCLQTYSHMLQSIFGRDKHPSPLPAQRQKDLFQRALKKAKDSQAITMSRSSDGKPRSSSEATASTITTNSSSATTAPVPVTGINLAQFVSASTPPTTTLTLPKTKFTLQGKAAELLQALPPKFHNEALQKCDEEALRVIQKGTPVKPEHFVQVLENFGKTIARIHGKDAANHNISAIAGPTSVKTNTMPGSAAITKHATNPPKILVKKKEGDNSKATNKQQPGMLILKKQQEPQPPQQQQQQQQSNLSGKRQSQNTNQNQKQPVNSSKKSNTTIANDNNKSNDNKNQFKNKSKKQLEQIILDLQQQIVDLHQQHAQEKSQWQQQLQAKDTAIKSAEKRNDDLHKLLANEKHIVTAVKARVTTLENSLQSLSQSQSSEKQKYQEQNALVENLQQQLEQQQSEYRELVTSFTKLSSELCHVQQAKRQLQMELEDEQVLVSAKDDRIAALQQALKKSEMLRPVPRNAASMARLQRDLQGTPQKSGKTRDKPSLADFVLGEDPHQIQRSRSSEEAATAANTTIAVATEPMVQILRRSSSAEDDPYQATTTATKTTTLNEDQVAAAVLTACQQEVQQEAANAMAVQFHGIDRGYDQKAGDTSMEHNGSSHDDDDNDSEEQHDLTTQIDFLLASFGEEEIQIEHDAISHQPTRVVRNLQLECDRNGEVVPVHLILTLPEGYPGNGIPLQIEASLAPSSSSDPPRKISVEAQKVSMDALPSLVDVCRWEANAGQRDALFAVLQTADQWVQTEWQGLQAKRLPADASGKACLAAQGTTQLNLARMLLSTHHLVDTEKIAAVKNTARNYQLGGYVKLGYPGYVLIEGLEDNCSFFVESLAQQRMKLRTNSQRHKGGSGKPDSATFSVAGKVVTIVDNLDEGRDLPRKLIEIDKSREGLDCFKEFCDKVGLSEYIE